MRTLAWSATWQNHAVGIDRLHHIPQIKSASVNTLLGILSMELLSGTLLYNVVKDIAKFRGRLLKVSETRTKTRLEEHITWAEGWSRTIQMFGMTKALPTEQKSITLSISDRPRKFSSPDSKISTKKLFSEDEILDDEKNYVILGDPGCGKTTLCKRLTRQLILSEPSDPIQCLDAPLVILGRDLHLELQLIPSICNIFGIEFEAFNESEHREALQGFSDREEFNRQLRKRRDEWNQNVNLEAKSLLYRALGAGRFILIVDGLDEINSNYRTAFEHDLAELLHNCPQLKLLSTCRAGDWTRSIITADLLSIEPLNDLELREIVEAWADKPEAFLDAISMVPYREVLDRPLFLTLLLIIFNQGYELPDCPVDVYDRITTLLIERWDRERDISRESKFSSFLSEKKLRFLSSLAYNLTFENHTKRFSLDELNSLYLTLAPRFKLPHGEFSSVLQEIESHTGIIVESGFEHFEFCHLTVQEFLSAKHLVSLASSRNHLVLLEESPATVAVATSVSSEPSKFLASILEDFCSVQERNLNRGVAEGLESFFIYIARLRLELPEFSENNNLAIGVIRLWILSEKLQSLGYSKSENVAEAGVILSEFDAIRLSIENLLRRPGVKVRQEDEGLTLIKTMGRDYEFRTAFLDWMAG